MATAVANQQQPTLFRDPMPPTIAAVPQFVSGTQTYTPPDPNVAVAAPLGTTANRYMHSSARLTTLATAVTSIISRQWRLSAYGHRTTCRMKTTRMSTVITSITA
eukprot:scaffold92563_cov47-Attheya_sp.AAC.2